MPGLDVVSDPVDLDVPDDAELAITVAVLDDGGAATQHPEGLQTGYAAPFASVDSPILPGAREFTELHWIKGVDMSGEAARGEPVIVAFGDSLTDGSGTTPNAHQRYPDHLWRRLGVPVLNTGIGGNRLLANGFGPAGVLRFARDALGVPGVTHVIIALGVNDLGLTGRPVTASALIAGYTALAARAREAGVVPVGATLPPFGGAVYPGYHTGHGEQTRAEFNAWMRASSGKTGLFAAHLDMDAALRDPARPVLLREDLHFGDGLHPNDAGARAIAAAVSPSAFGL
ncbi:GDSL-type esterase/lipase family protein [Actinocorallia sp. A-T 12471]|uniref:GDSL-type esterase/lipase family protein n=1 Tax=Actinocorallia sp. A-T 12471 TaxID=3089813 RepID=UPI0029CECCD1|nr:GDSL-type esterase/lipase family protein [Actinocorallia sp. A-T 12471]MDX6743304.1 GDSL-type esterase/lipase family protein [Actinocorallia sp. A-T 12471]